jgi:glycosyltransferase involved in cell wall biosynthesis
MKLAIYTTVKNGLYLDYHIVAMLKHHLPLADEIIVIDGYSNDGTFEAVSRIDPKIKVIRARQEPGTPFSSFYVLTKGMAREACTSDWSILLDCDEFIPEWEFDRLRRYLETAPRPIIPCYYLNFYGNYRVYHARPKKVRWPAVKNVIHRNMPNIVNWGDGSNVSVSGVPDAETVDQQEAFECHHMGFVRHPARLRQKWRMQSKLLAGASTTIDWMIGSLFNFAPHDWLDKQFLDDLTIYDGQPCQAVRDDPNEFIRDKNKVLDYLRKRQADGFALPAPESWR